MPKNTPDYVSYFTCSEQTPEMLLNNKKPEPSCKKTLNFPQTQNSSEFSQDTSTWD